MSSKKFISLVLSFMAMFMSCSSSSRADNVQLTEPYVIDISSSQRNSAYAAQYIFMSVGDMQYDEAKHLYNLICYNSQKFSIPVNIIIGMASVESDFRAGAISRSGIKAGAGMFQVSDLGRQDYNDKHGTNFTTDDLFTIEVNIEIACWIFKQNIKYGVDDNIESLLAAYNLGCGFYLNNKEQIDSGMITWKGVTREYNYVKDVLGEASRV